MEASDAGQTECCARQPVSRLSAFWRGIRETSPVPAIILSTAFVGFGALTNQIGLSLLDTVFISVFMFALPGQVVLVDEIARGASVFTAAIAVAATGVRLLPMTVVMLPVIRDRNGPKWLELAVAYYVAVTVWVESMRRAPHIPRPLRSAYCLGICALLVFVSGAGAIVGYLLASEVPPLLAAALLFMTPLYFLLSMLVSARTMVSLAPILLGLVLGPIFHLLTPSLDLLLTGLAGGTAAFLLANHVENRPPRS
jgi:predicted branched-subunit amino acid permease